MSSFKLTENMRTHSNSNKKETQLLQQNIKTYYGAMMAKKASDLASSKGKKKRSYSMEFKKTSGCLC